MLKQRLQAAERVAEQLTPAETDIDNTISSLMALSVAMMTAITEAKLPRVLAQDAFDSLGEAIGLMFAARSKVVDTHHHLNAARTQIGLRAVSFGLWQDCPPMGAAAEERADNVVPIAA
jgi:uncharacterized protein YqgV (UPF0045/DUF77 family)